MTKLLASLLISLIFISCTHIISSNFPGKEQKQLPASWVGKYDAKLPSFLQFFFSGSSQKLKVEITRNGLVWGTEDSTVSTYTTSDSLRFSETGGHKYISLHNSHNQYTVFRVKETAKGLELYGMSADEDIEQEQLIPYFKNVDLKVSDEDSVDTGIKLYEVEIDDSKLNSFFSSKIPAKDPIVLTRKK